jgi:predicted secreted protein
MAPAAGRGMVGADMEVFAVTIFMSLAFAVLFAVLFFAERSQRQRRSVEQMALLPLDTDPGADATRR